MDFFNDIFHNLTLLEFYFLNIIYILIYINFILSIFFQHSNILTRASHHWRLASNIVLVIPWICYKRSFSEFYLSIWNQLVFNQRLQLFVQSPQPYLWFFAWRNWMCFPNILVKKQMNIWIPQNKPPGIEMLIIFLCQLLPEILFNDAASTCCEKS